MASLPPANSYNNVYERLVKDRTDVVGAIAYALYKHDKRAYMRDRGLVPGHPDMADYHLRLGENTLNGFRRTAEEALAATTAREVAIAHEKARKEILDELSRTKGALTELIQKHRSRFWPGVWASLLASVILGVVILLLVRFDVVGLNPLDLVFKKPAAASAPTP